MIATLRPATLDDLSQIQDLTRHTPGSPNWNDRQCEAEVRSASSPNADRVFLVAEAASCIAAFCVVRHSGFEAELEAVVVASDQRRQGLARQLCIAGFLWAEKNGAHQVWLEVRESNVVAQELYRSLGFFATGKRSSYYRQPDEDAVMMCLNLQAASHL